MNDKNLNFDYEILYYETYIMKYYRQKIFKNFIFYINFSFKLSNFITDCRETAKDDFWWVGPLPTPSWLPWSFYITKLS